MPLIFSTGTLIATPDESLYRTMRREGKKSIHRERILAYSTVGTPDYIAPEVLSQKVSGVVLRMCCAYLCCANVCLLMLLVLVNYMWNEIRTLVPTLVASSSIYMYDTLRFSAGLRHGLRLVESGHHHV